MVWQPGCNSPNPSGRPRGTPDKRTQLRKLLEPYASELVDILIDEARKREPSAIRLCIERLIPKIKSETIDINLPEKLTKQSVSALCDQVLRNLANQEITLEQGKDMIQIIQGHLNASDMTAIFNEISELRDKFRQFIEASRIGDIDTLKQIKSNLFQNNLASTDNLTSNGE